MGRTGSVAVSDFAVESGVARLAPCRVSIPQDQTIAPAASERSTCMAPSGTGESVQIPLPTRPEPPVPFASTHNGGPHGRSLVIGAGPAGLTAGYMFAKDGIPATVLEAEGQVGG